MLDRTQAPVAQGIPITPILQSEKHVFSNGLNLFALSASTFKTIKFEVSIPRSYETTNYALVYLTTRMLQEGTKHLSSEQISNKIAANGAFFEISVSNDYINLELYCLRPFFKGLLSLVYSIIYSPSFPEKEFENLKSRYVQQFLNNIEKTSYLASVHSKLLLFGSHHPYTTNISLKEIQTIDIESVKGYYKSYIQNVIPQLFLTGEFGEEEVKMIEKVFGPLGSESLNEFFQQKPQGFIGEKFIEKENAVQNTLSISTKSVLRTHQDYHKLVVTNEILGGFFGSRLMKNIREDKGFTYGIYSRLVSLKNDAYLHIGTDLKLEYVVPCIEEIKKEIQILKTDKISESELYIVCLLYTSDAADD